MARYSCVTQFSGSAEHLDEAIRAVLERCRLNVLHNSVDYWVAGEPPGQTPFSKLVKVEVLMSRKKKQGDDCVEVTCIAKNEELPLRNDNHCQQTFDQLKSELTQLQTELKLAASRRNQVRL
jgi:hypothetical protein